MNPRDRKLVSHLCAIWVESHYEVALYFFSSTVSRDICYELLHHKSRTSISIIDLEIVKYENLNATL